MTNYFEYTEIVSNGFITSCDYFQTKVNAHLLNRGYLNVYSYKGQKSVISISDFLMLIINSGLSEEQQAEIKIDSEDSQVFIYTNRVSTAEKLDSVVNLLVTNSHIENIIDQNISNFNAYTSEMIVNLLASPRDIYFDGSKIGQLEWLDYAQYCNDNNQIVDSINAYNKYYIQTNENTVGFNLAVLLSSINLDLVSIEYYKKIISNGYDCNHNLALSYYKLNDYDNALQSLSNIDFEQSHKSYLLKAQILIMQNEYKQALIVLNQGFIYLKHINVIEANRIKKLFIEVNNYIK